MNTHKEFTIPRIDRFMERFNARMKFLVGNDVRIGVDYYGWETVDGERYDGICRPIHFDNSQLYVLEKGVEGVVVLWGDMADYKDRLIADRRHARYSIPDLRSKVDAYMAKNGITEYTSEVGSHALWVKMMPQSVVQERVKVYEMTKELI
ncbi:MAG: hypothetical protein IJ089_01920 [Clostridia bacterium]|nr:hypothetical protein [Clostridia bacterium]